MNVTLALPSLLWPAAAAAIEPPIAAPALARLLRGRAIGSPLVEGPETWLAERCGLATRPDAALAPALALAEGLPGASGYWLLAEPVHLQLGHDDVSLGSCLGALPAPENATLLATLNTHFAPEEWSFSAAASGRWYLRTPKAPALQTHPPRLAWQRPVRFFLPAGDSGRTWHRALTEIQMLLHEHPANRDREARGAPPVNSLWFWGGGQYSSPKPAIESALIVSPGLALDLFHACGLKPEASPEDAGGWTPSADETLIWLDSLDTPMMDGGTAGWAAALAKLEADWCAPLVQKVHQGRIDKLRLLAFGRELMQITEYRKPSLWQRIRQPKAPPLSHLLQRTAGEESTLSGEFAIS